MTPEERIAAAGKEVSGRLGWWIWRDPDGFMYHRKVYGPYGCDPSNAGAPSPHDLTLWKECLSLADLAVGLADDLKTAERERDNARFEISQLTGMGFGDLEEIGSLLANLWDLIAPEYEGEDSLFTLASRMLHQLERAEIQRDSAIESCREMAEVLEKMLSDNAFEDLLQGIGERPEWMKLAHAILRKAGAI